MNEHMHQPGTGRDVCICVPTSIGRCTTLSTGCTAGRRWCIQPIGLVMQRLSPFENPFCFIPVVGLWKRVVMDVCDGEESFASIGKMWVWDGTPFSYFPCLDYDG